VVQQVGELLAKERRDDGGWGLVGTETMGVGGAHDRGFEQSVVTIDTHEGLYDEHHEAQVVLRRLAGTVQQDARVGGEAPVVVLARAVDAGKRLLVEQAGEPVALGDLLEHFHGQLVVVGCDVGGGEDRREFVLCGRNLVVLGLGGDAEFPQLHIQILHEVGDLLLEHAEVVIL